MSPVITGSSLPVLCRVGCSPGGEGKLCGAPVGVWNVAGQEGGVRRREGEGRGRLTSTYS